MFELFAKQYELARVDESREGAVIQVLDAAQPPERKAKPKRALIAVMIAVPALLALTLLWPVARGLFRFGPLHGDDIALVLGAAAVMIGVLEPVKAVIRRMSATARAR